MKYLFFQSPCYSLQDPLAISGFCGSFTEQPELNSVVDEMENNKLEDPIDVSRTNDVMKEEPGLKFSADASDNNIDACTDHLECELLSIEKTEEVVTTRYASDSTCFRLTGVSDENYSVSLEETVLQSLAHDKLTRKEITLPITCQTQTGGFIHQGNNTICNGDYSLRENELHDYTCSVCQRRFPSKYKLIMHVFMHMDGIQPPLYICRRCGEVFQTDLNLKSHLMRYENGQNLSVMTAHSFPITRRACKTSNAHVANGGPNSTSDNCQLDYHHWCVKLSQPHVSSETHKDSHATKNVCLSPSNDKAFGYKCNTDLYMVPLNSCRLDQQNAYSEKSFDQAGALKNHILINVGERRHVCGFCGKTFAQPFGLKRHTLIHTGQRPNKCDICGKSFSLPSHLKEHKVVHTGERPYKCDVCGKSFSLSSTLKRHKGVHTGERPQKCDICGKSFYEYSNLKKHHLVHTGERRHKCEICGKSFSQYSNLKKHHLVHTGERHHRCDICGKSFTQSSDLKIHNFIHTGERPHKCDICSKSFTQSGDLKRHKFTHTGESHHKCDICCKSFAEPGGLRRHKLVHVGERPHN